MRGCRSVGICRQDVEHLKNFYEQKVNFHHRLGRMVVAFSKNGEAITADDLVVGGIGGVCYDYKHVYIYISSFFLPLFFYINIYNTNSLCYHFNKMYLSLLMYYNVL